MASFDAVNYSLRPSKSIQRHVVFECLRILQTHIALEDMVYVGFGSVWFTDFLLAHKLLKVDDMVSIEADKIGFHRARFNNPYSTVRIWEGRSSDKLPELADDVRVRTRPWCVWLDYDYEFDENVKDDCRWLVENAPANSIILLTFNGYEMRYGRAPERPERLRELFGDAVPDDLPKNACQDERMQQTLADYSLDFMKSAAGELARPGGFLPAFRIVYRDSAPMVTVGGVLPAKGAVKTVADAIAAESWTAFPKDPIVAPHLTAKEAITLQSLLPCAETITRDAVQKLGFDLEDDQIKTFQTYYKQYPTFAQIVS